MGSSVPSSNSSRRRTRNLKFHRRIFIVVRSFIIISLVYVLETQFSIFSIQNSSNTKNAIENNKSHHSHDVFSITEKKNSTTTWITRNNTNKNDSITNAKSSNTTSSSSSSLTLQPPYRIIQIGSPRSGSTYQYVMLISIVLLKEQQQQRQSSTSRSGSSKNQLMPVTEFIPTWKQEYHNKTEWFMKEVLSDQNRSFIVKTHLAVPSSILPNVSIFSSGPHSFGSKHGLYTQHSTNDVNNCPRCEITNYQKFFDLTSDEITILEHHMSLFTIIRQCCGRQMSDYEVMRLNGCNMSMYYNNPSKPNYEPPDCQSHNITQVEYDFQASPIPYLHKHWSKPGDCQLSRDIAATGKGFNGMDFTSCDEYYKRKGKG